MCIVRPVQSKNMQCSSGENRANMYCSVLYLCLYGCLHPYSSSEMLTLVTCVGWIRSPSRNIHCKKTWRTILPVRVRHPIFCIKLHWILVQSHIIYAAYWYVGRIQRKFLTVWEWKIVPWWDAEYGYLSPPPPCFWECEHDSLPAL